MKTKPLSIDAVLFFVPILAVVPVLLFIGVNFEPASIVSTVERAREARAHLAVSNKNKQ
jgi:hypothetical protein